MVAKSEKVKVTKEEVIEDEELKFVFRKFHLVLPQGGNVPRKAMRALEDNRMITFIEEMLGKEQLAEIDAELTTLRDIQELSDAITAAQDTTLGE